MNCTPTHYLYASILALVLGVECWLGKTEKVKASSIVELAFLLVVGIATTIFVKKEKPNVS